ELAAKRLALLRELVPAAGRVAVLLNPAEVAIAAANLRDVETAARAMALEIKIFNARTSGEIDATFAAIACERPDAVFISSGPLFTSRRVQLAHLATHHRIPAIHAFLSRSRWADQLRSKCAGCASSGRCLRRPHPQGLEARGLAGRADEQIRAGHQSPDR